LFVVGVVVTLIPLLLALVVVGVVIVVAHDYIIFMEEVMGLELALCQ
jgi:hypothetical protein